VETALTLTALMFLILGIVQFSLLFWQWNTMLLAVSQAGRYVMVSKAPGNTTCDTTCAKTRMQLVLTSASGSCANPATPAGGQMCVSATSTATAMTLSATYGLNLLQLTAPSIKLSTSMTVPLQLE
jgi:Flp pilus assembly protein TadG